MDLSKFTINLEAFQLLDVSIYFNWHVSSSLYLHNYLLLIFSSRLRHMDSGPSMTESPSRARPSTSILAGVYTHIVLIQVASKLWWTWSIDTWTGLPVYQLTVDIPYQNQTLSSGIVLFMYFSRALQLCIIIQYPSTVSCHPQNRGHMFHREHIHQFRSFHWHTNQADNFHVPQRTYHISY